jgi:cell division septation protein DedD
MSADSKHGLKRAFFLGLVVIGSVVIFALGVMVGTNVTIPPEAFVGKGSGGAPGAGPKKESLREEIALPKKGADIKGEEMTFYKTLAESGKGTPSGASPTPYTIPTSPIAPTAAAPTSGTAPSAVAPAPTTAPTATPAPTVAPPPAPAKAAGKQWYIHVTAMVDQKGARAVADSLTKAGYPISMTEKGKLNIVRVGGYAQETEAKKIMTEIRKKPQFKEAFLARE